MNIVCHPLALTVILSVVMLLTSPAIAYCRIAQKGLKRSIATTRITGASATSGSAAAGEDLKTFLLEYKYVDNMAEKRTPHRAEHIALAQKLIETNQIVAGGAYVPDLDGAMFIFKSSSRSVVEDFVKKDPYVKHGLVPKHSIKEWNVVVGSI